MNKQQIPVIVPDNHPLLLAISVYQNIDQVKNLLEAGGNPNIADSDGRTLLCEAVQVCNKELVALLLQHGADPNIADKYGRAPLYIVSILDNCPEDAKEKISKLLIEHGADANNFLMRLLKWGWDRVEHKIVDDIPWAAKSVLDILKSTLYVAESLFITSAEIGKPIAKLFTKGSTESEPVKEYKFLQVPLLSDLKPSAPEPTNFVNKTLSATLSAIYNLSSNLADMAKMIGALPYYGMVKLFDWSDEILGYRNEPTAQSVETPDHSYDADHTNVLHQTPDLHQEL